MPVTLTLRFQKFDTYSNAIFIASSDNVNESKTFDRITNFAKQLEHHDTFLPIYTNEKYKYATVRTKKNSRYTNMIENSVYTITFDTKKKKKDDKTYVNCYLRNLKLVKKAEPLDEGSDVEFE
jgi:hypothetical protein